MNILEQIKAEIERLHQEALQSADTEKVEKRLAWQRQVHFYEGKVSAYKSVLAFLDTLSQEKPSEDLKEELDRWRHHHFAGERDGLYSGEYLLRDSQLDIARHFAEWQKNKMMIDAVDATVSETTRIIPGCGSYTGAFQCKEIHIKVSEEFKKGEKVKALIIKKNRI